MLATWKTRANELKLHQLILGTLLVYVTLHFFEEGLFDFAGWAELRWRIPNYTTSKWLLHNVYFIFFLGLGYILFRRDPSKFLPAGLGINIWGLMNGLSHIIFSLIFLEYSPGLFTGLIFIGLAIPVYQRVREDNLLKTSVIGFSILAGLLYWRLPIFMFIEIDKLIGI
jgi:hypothetical protein